jgi:hypothetical protein
VMLRLNIQKEVISGVNKILLFQNTFLLISTKS